MHIYNIRINNIIKRFTLISCVKAAIICLTKKINMIKYCELNTNLNEKIV
jgi:hypothetical protein